MEAQVLQLFAAFWGAFGLWDAVWALVKPVWPLIWVMVKIFAIILPLLGCVAYLTLAERKVIAWMQVRVGPNRVTFFGIKWLGGLAQPIADGLKLLFKEIVLPSASSKMLFVLAPVLALAPSLAAWAVVPFSRWLWCWPTSTPVCCYIMAITSMGVYGVIIAGWASNSKYAFLGSLRSAAQIVAYEIAMGFALVCVLMVSQSLNLSDIVRGQGEGCSPTTDSVSCRGTGFRCCRCSSCISFPASPRPTARPSTWWKGNPKSLPATWSNTRAWLSRCSSSPNTRT
jgi:NADH:ubiquinone oxidoreductase subunit H